MQILELQIKNFGKFSNQTITFQDGMNIYYGENEMGKTTIHAFIRGMLFGIERMRGKASRNDEYMLREPWENPGYYAGVMRFRSGRKVFRIERSFSKNQKKAVLICETDGEELDIQRGDLQMLLEGISEQAFCNTVFIRQKSSQTDEGLAEELQNYMANVESAGDDEIDVSKAVAQLRERQKEYGRKKKTREGEETQRRQEIETKIKYVQQELEMQNAQYESGCSKLSQMREHEVEARTQKLHDLQQEFGESEGYKKRKILLVAAGAAVLIAGLFIGFFWLRISAVIAVLLAGIGFWHTGVCEKKESRKRQEKKERIEKEVYPSQQLMWNLERMKEELQEKRTQCENMMESIKELHEGLDQDLEEEQERQAIELAVNTILEISDEIYKESARRLDETASGILNDITEGRYTSIYLDSSMQVRINTPEKLLGLEQVSRGTMDQIYFSLRMAAAAMFCPGESLPVILDDAFAMYDDKRLKNTLRWLEKSGMQVLLFTCHKRERRLLDEIYEEQKEDK